MATNFGLRFEELSRQADAIEASKKGERSRSGNTVYYVDQDELINWTVKVRHLIASVCGQDSQHFVSFEKFEKPYAGATNHQIFHRQRAVFLATKEDYEGGYLTRIRDLIQAEVFESELEQAEELLNTGYLTAAAVIAGVVLETSLRQLCLDKNIATGSLDRMNADLAKLGVFSKLIQKQITALADVRNKAAHGHSNQFVKADVTNMIRDVTRLVVDFQNTT